MLKSVLLSRTHSSDLQWDELRRIRNSCAPFMTGFQGEITPEMQEEYRRTFPEDVRHFLFYTPRSMGWVAVGYGRLVYNFEEESVAATYGVAEWERGKGYGRWVARLTCLAAGMDIQSERFADNVAIKSIDHEIGFDIFATYDDKERIVCSWPPPGIVDWGR